MLEFTGTNTKTFHRSNHNYHHHPVQEREKLIEMNTPKREEREGNYSLPPQLVSSPDGTLTTIVSNCKKKTYGETYACGDGLFSSFVSMMCHAQQDGVQDKFNEIGEGEVQTFATPKLSKGASKKPLQRQCSETLPDQVYPGIMWEGKAVVMASPGAESSPMPQTRHSDYIPTTPSFQKSMYSYSFASSNDDVNNPKILKSIESFMDKMGCTVDDEFEVVEDDTELHSKPPVDFIEINEEKQLMELNNSFDSGLTDRSYVNDIPLAPPPPLLKSKGVFEMFLDAFGGDGGLCNQNIPDEREDDIIDT